MRLSFGFHPRRRLAAWLDGELGARDRVRVERHLRDCPDCRARLARLRGAAEALRSWPVTSGSPPFELPAPGRTYRRPRPRRLVPALGFGAAALLALLLVARAATVERLELYRPTDAPSRFERLALAEHAALRRPRPELELENADATAIRTWLRSHGSFSADLLDLRPAALPAFELLGARRAEESGLGAAAVALRIDGGAVTLLVGHAGEVEGLPSWSLLGKRLQVRRDPASGAHLLSWEKAGKAYTLVTDPDVPPRLACQLCHVQPRRLETIERVAGEL